ncbi:BadF/BadG/BcrA/BcrD ATPase family protein [Limimaricola pyoseonensis]|uniref:Glucosamine kinase n=1 Tax=Limimaricola pyoseonensis TaxID=521013 RepID=A0A1G7L4F1_9RHOB|nr:BadF/BadG/BcrA/BcrD ATPase family protein [Limimaricola pyoseonensis]SDF44422.1 glucosamine kinase [Limimaricola pyoseonensis]
MTLAIPVLGIDGGGSGCRAALWRDGAVIGTGQAGPANLTSDFEGGVANILAAVARAAEAAGLDPQALRAAVAHAGLAGVQSAEMARGVAARLPFRCRVTEDRDIAIAGALGPGGDGAVLAIGTGSFVGLRRAGKIRAVGGWGLQLSDVASAAWLGRAALSATLEAVDGMRAQTGLGRALLDRFGAPPGIVAFAARATPAEYGALAPLVTGAAERGDAMGAALLAEGAAWCERALAALGHRDEAICLIGGLGPAYRAALDRPGRRFADPRGTPLDGALILARRFAEEGA